MCDLIQVWTCANIYICLNVTSCESTFGRDLDGEMEWGRKWMSPAWGFHFCAPLSMEGPCHVMELLPCGGSGCLAGPPDSLSPCLQWLPAHQFTFNYLLSQMYSEEVQEHSIKTFWRFYPITVFFGHLEWIVQSRLHDILICLKFRIMRPVCPHFKRFFFSKVSIFLIAIQDCLSSFRLDRHYVALKEECWS